MNRLFAAMVQKHTPKMNPAIMNGLACLYLPLSAQWLDAIIRSGDKSLPKGLEYKGSERCTHFEEYEEATKLRNSKRIFDLADSSLYLMKWHFDFTDADGVVHQVPTRFIYLLYCEEAGVFRLGGTPYHITPVLSDKVISPSSDSIFVRLIRDRITFRRLGHGVMVNGKRDTFNVVWSWIYRKKTSDKSMPATTKALTCVGHYLFAKFGVREAFRRYAGFVPEIGRDFDATTHDPDKWVVCRSTYYGTTIKPLSFVGNFYQPTDICLAIPKDMWGPASQSLVTEFFYVLDHFPDRFRPEWVDDTFIWCVLLGEIIFSGVYTSNKLYASIVEHYASLDDYLDVGVADKLKEIGVEVGDFYDLIAYIMSNFASILLDNNTSVNSMFGKNTEILYNVLSEITIKYFKAIYKLKKNEAKRPLTIRSVTETFNKMVTQRSIFNIVSSKMVCSSVSYCGDHKYPKLTSKLTEQESGGSSHRRVSLGEESHLHVSQLEAGSVLFLSKTNPKPSSRLNPYACIDLKTGTIVPNPKFKDILEQTQRLLTTTRDHAGEFEEPVFEDEFEDVE